MAVYHLYLWLFLSRGHFLCGYFGPDYFDLWSFIINTIDNIPIEQVDKIQLFNIIKMFKTKLDSVGVFVSKLLNKYGKIA